MDRAGLGVAWDKLKTGTLWASTGRCKGYAPSNPGEAYALDQYVALIVAGGNPTKPDLATATGQGLAGIIAAGLYTPFRVAITGTPKSGSTLTATVTQ